MNTITSPAGKKLAITKEVLTTLMSTISSFEYLFKNSNIVLQNGHGIRLSGGGEDPQTGVSRPGLIFLNNELFFMNAGDESIGRFSIDETNTSMVGVDVNGNQYETNIKLRVANIDPSGTYFLSNLHPMSIMLQHKRFEIDTPSLPSNLHPNLEILTDTCNVYTDNRNGMFYCSGKVRVKEDMPILGNVDINIFSVPALHSVQSHPTAIDKFYFTVYIYRANASPVRTYSRLAYVNKADRKVYIHNSSADTFNLEGLDEIYFDFSYYTDYVNV
jgi:hypothetical protein